MKKKLFFVIVFILVAANIYSADNQIIFNGSGDDIISIVKEEEDLPYLLFINGNEEERHFAVKSYDENGNYLDLLVNTTEKYIGTVPIDLPVGTNTKMLEITATGKWGVIVIPISLAHHIDIGVEGSYTGDTVLWVNGEAKIAEIEGNIESRHFSVIAYDEYGNYSKLLVNTCDVYSGKVLLPKNTLLLKVSAKGNWSINLK